jgi:quinoprotein glucose dehydrogenase
LKNQTALLLAAACSLCHGTALAQAGAMVEWPYYGGNSFAQHYSPLDQINASNVGQLEVVWRWSAANFGPRPEARSQITPLMIDGVLYATAGTTRSIVAIDARSGETLWVWRPNEGERFDAAPRKMSGRGVAYWTDGEGDRRIITVTPGFHLAALDAETGRPVESFGDDGIVDIMEYIRGPEDNIIIGSTSPPMVVNDVIVVGPAHGVGARPNAMAQTKGDIQAFDVRTGRRLWTFHTIPAEGEFGYDTWLERSAEYTGNAGAWGPLSADPALGMVYIPVEAPTGDFYGGPRPGNNLFANSLVALDIETGERVWHYQLIHHDIWDWDNPTAPILLDVTIDGRAVKAVVQPTKQAFAYAFNRETGEPLWPIEEVEVAPSDVPGEWTSPTQPKPTRPAAYDRQGFSVDDLIDFTPEIRAAALASIDGLRLGPMFTPASLASAEDGTRGTLMLPNYGGGTNWEGGAADPETGFFYVPSITDPAVASVRADAGTDVGYTFVAGQVPQPMDLPLVKPPWSRITAIDMNTGEHAWMVPNGATPDEIRNNPALAGVELPQTGGFSHAMLLVTKTLLFVGEGWNGAPVIRALDKATGATIAEVTLPGATGAKPMTYMLDGRQYLVVSIGQPGPAELVALALPD